LAFLLIVAAKLNIRTLFSHTRESMMNAPGHGFGYITGTGTSLCIETCSECGDDVRIIACIEDPAVIRKILAHLDEKVISAGTGLLPQYRAPPATGLLV
jgi:hypothetical protein